MDFLPIKKSFTKKKKLMLWIDMEIIDTLDSMKPPHITIQEAIRQILKNFIEDGDELGGL